MLPVNFLQISDQFIYSCTNFICRVSQCHQSIVHVHFSCVFISIGAGLAQVLKMETLPHGFDIQLGSQSVSTNN